MSTTSTQIQLVNRPVGWPKDSDFRTVQVTLDDLAPGEVRVANEFVSVDPYMRGRMIDTRSYVPPFKLDETMTGGAVGRVVDSRSDDVPVGALVLHQLGWRDVAQGPATAFTVLPEPPTDANGDKAFDSSLYLGVLGMTGLTAYVGLTEIANMKQGDVVFISGAAGAVGTAAGQIARLLGAKAVIGSAGSAEKVELLTGRYGFDVALNYKDGPIRKQLRAAATDGIDVYFRRRRSPRGGARRLQRRWACGAVWRDRRLQLHRANSRARQHVQHHHPRTDSAWLHRRASLRQGARVHREDVRLAGLGGGRLRRDGRRRDRPRGRCLPRHDARSEHRQDGRAHLTRHHSRRRRRAASVITSSRLENANRTRWFQGSLSSANTLTGTAATPIRSGNVKQNSTPSE